jgi:hypothetical protein
MYSILYQWSHIQIFFILLWIAMYCFSTFTLVLFHLIYCFCMCQLFEGINHVILMLANIWYHPIRKGVTYTTTLNWFIYVRTLRCSLSLIECHYKSSINLVKLAHFLSGQNDFHTPVYKCEKKILYQISFTYINTITIFAFFALTHLPEAWDK